VTRRPLDAAEDRAAPRDEVEREVGVEPDRVDVEGAADQLAERLDRRGERDFRIVVAAALAGAALGEERLLAEAIAREPERARRAVEKRDRVHPVDPLQQPVHPPRDEAVREDLRVAARLEREALRFELAAQRFVVVDLAVLEGDHLAVAREERLVAARDIDHREAAHRERDVALAEVAGAVGAAGVHPFVRREQSRPGCRPTVRRDETEDAAHAKTW